MANQEQSPFLHLPHEIRNKIYTYIFDTAKILGMQRSGITGLEQVGHLQLTVPGQHFLLVCRRICREAVAYQHTFTLLSISGVGTGRKLLRVISEQKRAGIQVVYIQRNRHVHVAVGRIWLERTLPRRGWESVP